MAPVTYDPAADAAGATPPAGRDIQAGELATKLGHGSESTSSTAFKRLLDESPLHYRRRVRAAA